MHFIIEKRTTSSRVRFLMQDVIDLKKASWKKRREEAGPKKIDQIHEVCFFIREFDLRIMFFMYGDDIQL